MLLSQEACWVNMSTPLAPGCQQNALNGRVVPLTVIAVLWDAAWSKDIGLCQVCSASLFAALTIAGVDL